MEFLSLHYWQEFALRYGIYGLTFNAFIEAVFFPIPPDVLLITLCMADPKNAFLYALVAHCHLHLVVLVDITLDILVENL